MSLAEPDFLYLERLLRERSGLALTREKAYLVNTRLRPIMEERGHKTISDLLGEMRRKPKDGFVEDVVDAMTTNESLFFRDRKPFEALTEMMLPTLAQARPRSRPIRIWCAAASTGQEPYSIAILLQENASRLPARKVEILATDLSRAALKRAQSGEFTAFEVGRGMPKHYLERYFTRGERNHHFIVPEVRDRVRFQYRNLLESFEGLGRFDIVFCRNVLIYFDQPTKRDVLERIAAVMSPDGYLVLGGPETTLGLTDEFRRHADWRNVYERSSAQPRASTLLGSGVCAST